MNLNRQQLINEIYPLIAVFNKGKTEAEVRQNLANLPTADLERMYQQVAAVPDAVTAAANRAAQNTPDAIENQRLKREIELQNALRVCFATPVPEAGNRTVKNIDANRETLTSWLEAETEPIKNVQKWFLGIFKNNPKLAQTNYAILSWDELPVSAAQHKAELEQQYQADWRTFVDWCRTSGRVSASHANYQVIMQTLGSPLRYEELNTLVIDLPSGPALLHSGGDVVELSPQTRAEQQQFRQERTILDQAHLRDLRDTNDIAALRARARRDRERSVQTDFALNQEFQLSQAFEKDVLRDNKLEELPSHYRGKPLDHVAIKQLDRTAMRPLIERFGYARLTARLFGYKKVRRFDSIGNPIDGAPEYVFEKGE